MTSGAGLPGSCPSSVLSGDGDSVFLSPDSKVKQYDSYYVEL